MENSKNQGNKPIPQYPKATDELQKHIETVIPDAEKEDSPSANAAPEQVAHQESAISPEKPDQGQQSNENDS